MFINLKDIVEAAVFVLHEQVVEQLAAMSETSSQDRILQRAVERIVYFLFFGAARDGGGACVRAGAHFQARCVLSLQSIPYGTLEHRVTPCST